MESALHQIATIEQALELGLRADEFEMIKEILGRTPNFTETAVYAEMWSEPCSLKNSIIRLKTSPTDIPSENLIKEEENGGLADLGDGIICVLKMESYIQPNTAIIDDVIAKGTQPIAQLFALHFGNVVNDKTKLLVNEVSKSMVDFGNKSSVLNFCSKVSFDDSFNTNSLINTFSIGIVDTKKDISSKSQGTLVEDRASVYDREIGEPSYYKEYKNFNMESILQPVDLKEVAIKMLQMPNIASKNDFFKQQDSILGAADVLNDKSPSDATVVKIKGTNKSIAMAMYCNSRYVHADPQIGTMIAVSEAARKIVCAGGVPKATTYSMNFENPHNPEVYWQFFGAIKGMKKACLKFETPITGGEVSFYNQSIISGEEVPIYPIPTFSMIGIIEDKDRVMSMDFKEKGDLIFIIGECVNDISSSEYLASYHGVKASPAPNFNLEKEYAMQHTVIGMIQNELINAAHNVSVGGLYITLVEMSMSRELGFDIVTDSEIREDAFLFGESQGRVIVTVSEDQEANFIEFMMDSGVAFTLLGHVTKGKLMVDDEHFGFIKESKDLYNNALGRLLNN